MVGNNRDRDSTLCAVVGIIVWRKKGGKAKDPVLCPDAPTQRRNNLEKIGLHCSLEYRRSCASDRG